MLANLVFIFYLAHLVASLEHPEVRNYFEGDILGVSPYFNTRSGQKDPRYRWPNATIPFEFEAEYPLALRRRLYAAAKHISARTCVRFVPHSDQTDFIKVQQAHGCSSFVGRMGGSQLITLSERCSKGNFIHDLIHALGFFHEQSRPDRNQHVQIHFENICPGDRHNFRKRSWDQVTSFNVSYDYKSIMHYGNKAFSCNEMDTITTIPHGVPIGQRKGMSKTDILKVNRMYNCGNKEQL